MNKPKSRKTKMALARTTRRQAKRRAKTVEAYHNFKTQPGKRHKGGFKRANRQGPIAKLVQKLLGDSHELEV